MASLDFASVRVGDLGGRHTGCPARAGAGGAGWRTRRWPSSGRWSGPFGGPVGGRPARADGCVTAGLLSGREVSPAVALPARGTSAPTGRRRGGAAGAGRVAVTPSGPGSVLAVRRVAGRRGGRGPPWSAASDGGVRGLGLPSPCPASRIAPAVSPRGPARSAASPGPPLPGRLTRRLVSPVRRAGLPGHVGPPGFSAARPVGHLTGSQVRAAGSERPGQRDGFRSPWPLRPAGRRAGSTGSARPADRAG